MRKINHRLNLKKHLVLIGAILLLVGCSSEPPTPKETFEKSQEAMAEVKSFRVDLEESIEENSTEAKRSSNYQMDLKEDFIIYEDVEEGFNVFVINDEATIQEADGNIIDENNSEQAEALQEKMAFFNNPLDILEQLEDEIIDEFTMEAKDEEVILTYDESDDLAPKMFVFLVRGIDEVNEEEVQEIREYGLDELKLEIVMDNEYLLKDMNILMQGEPEGEKLVVDYQYTYSKYDDEVDITLPKEVPDEETEPNTETDPDINEEDAAAYLEALIQATVYQDADGYIKKLPESMGDSDNKKTGELQRDMFKDFYLENTKQNMADFDIKEEKYEALTDAFLGSLKQTKYEVGSTKIEDDRVVVTLDVEGINDSKLYEETNEELTKVAEKENLEMDEIAEKNIDMLIEAYKDVEITEPTTIKVNVNKLGEDYQVLLQDEFLLGGFVQ